MSFTSFSSLKLGGPKVEVVKDIPRKVKEPYSYLEQHPNTKRTSLRSVNIHSRSAQLDLRNKILRIGGAVRLPKDPPLFPHPSRGFVAVFECPAFQAHDFVFACILLLLLSLAFACFLDSLYMAFA